MLQEQLWGLYEAVHESEGFLHLQRSQAGSSSLVKRQVHEPAMLPEPWTADRIVIYDANAPSSQINTHYLTCVDALAHPILS